MSGVRYTVAMCGMTQVMAQKSITKEAKKVEREIKKQERLAQDAVEVLLDMVGAKDATFFYEGYSEEFAKGINRKVWNAANNL